MQSFCDRDSRCVAVGFVTRTRDILIPPLGTGASCPTLTSQEEADCGPCPDVTPPLLITTIPTNGADLVSLELQEVSMTFASDTTHAMPTGTLEQLQAGAGILKLWTESADLVAEIDVASGDVTIQNSASQITVTVKVFQQLTASTTYYITLPRGALLDQPGANALARNSFIGFSALGNPCSDDPLFKTLISVEKFKERGAWKERISVDEPGACMKDGVVVNTSATCFVGGCSARIESPGEPIWQTPLWTPGMCTEIGNKDYGLKRSGITVTANEACCSCKKDNGSPLTWSFKTGTGNPPSCQVQADAGSDVLVIPDSGFDVTVTYSESVVFGTQNKADLYVVGRWKVCTECVGVNHKAFGQQILKKWVGERTTPEKVGQISLDITNATFGDSKTRRFSVGPAAWNPTVLVKPMMMYMLQIPAGLAKNSASLDSSACSMEFRTADTMPPILNSSNPHHLQEKVSVSTQELQVQFSEPIKQGTAGKKVSVRTMGPVNQNVPWKEGVRTVFTNLAGSGGLEFGGPPHQTTLTIQIPVDETPLAQNTRYCLELQDDIAEDFAGNSWLGKSSIVGYGEGGCSGIQFLTFHTAPYVTRTDPAHQRLDVNPFITFLDFWLDHSVKYNGPVCRAGGGIQLYREPHRNFVDQELLVSIEAQSTIFLEDTAMGEQKVCVV